MLYSILLAIGLLASPAQWCGGGGMCCVPQRTRYLPPAVAARPVVIKLPAILPVEQWPAPAQLGMMLVAPRTTEILLGLSMLSNAR